MKRDLLLRLDRKISLIIRDNHYSNYERYFGIWTPRYRGQMWQDLGGPRILSLAAWREQVNRILANKRKVATRMGVDIHDRRGRSTALGKPGKHSQV